MSNFTEQQSKRDQFTFIINKVDGEQPLQFLEAVLPQGVLYLRSKIDTYSWVHYHLVLENDRDKMFIDEGTLTLDQFLELVEAYETTTLKEYKASWQPVNVDCELEDFLQ